MLTAMSVLAGLAAAIGILLAIANWRISTNPESPADRINRLLPQTQCGQCGFPGCLPYAEAIANGCAEIDQCAPGGPATVSALANLTGKANRPINPQFGRYQPNTIALINEDACIGCTLCFEACPVDAIVGAAQFSHTVLAAECTGLRALHPTLPG